MMQTAGRARGIHSDDHIRPRHANEAHIIADDLVTSPLLERLFDAERVAEVDRSSEVLLGGIETVHGFELFGSQHRERIRELGTDLVLPAVAARRRGENRAHALPAVQVHVQRVVLVVWMCRRLHEDAGVVELAESETESNRAVFEIDRTHAQLCVEPVVPGSGRSEYGHGRRHDEHDSCARQRHRISSG